MRESILFAYKKGIKCVKNANFICNNVDISSKSQVKYLGVTIDNNMLGYTMGNSVRKIIPESRFYTEKSISRFTRQQLFVLLLFIPVSIVLATLGLEVIKKGSITSCKFCQNKVIRYVLRYH